MKEERIWTIDADLSLSIAQMLHHSCWKLCNVLTSAQPRQNILMVYYVRIPCAVANFTTSVTESGRASPKVEGEKLWHFAFNSNCGHCTNATGDLQGYGVWFR
ncbi:uncharacterized protein ZBAI_07299 [Zygosaccharomyces bailii ISA1307]|nr:uncharacterized protein ZBAI_07299 [Zygosaccharomyces bailii ISA1307]